MRRAELLQEIRMIRFEEAYHGWQEQRLTQEEAAYLPGVCARTFRRYINRYEEEGFEPSMELSPHTRLAGERLQPARPSLRAGSPKKMAEGVGFEPTVLSHSGFQDRLLKPLGHPSN